MFDIQKYDKEPILTWWVLKWEKLVDGDYYGLSLKSCIFLNICLKGLYLRS